MYGNYWRKGGRWGIEDGRETKGEMYGNYWRDGGRWEIEDGRETKGEMYFNYWRDGGQHTKMHNVTLIRQIIQPLKTVVVNVGQGVMLVAARGTAWMEYRWNFDIFGHLGGTS